MLLAVNRCKGEFAEVSLMKYGEEGLSNEVGPLQELFKSSDEGGLFWKCRQTIKAAKLDIVRRLLCPDGQH